jgi:hypothetical protein
MCDVPSMAVFYKESIECCPGIVSRYFCKLLLTIIIIIIMHYLHQVHEMKIYSLWLTVSVCEHDSYLKPLDGFG